MNILVCISAGYIKKHGWNPKYSEIKTIISTAYNWHKSHPNGYKRI